jgi:hypothetical protein
MRFTSKEEDITSFEEILRLDDFRYPFINSSEYVYILWFVRY